MVHDLDAGERLAERGGVAQIDLQPLRAELLDLGVAAAGEEPNAVTAFDQELDDAAA